MNVRNAIFSAATAFAVVAAPVAASAADASKLSIAKSARASANVEDGERLGGGGIIVAILAAAAVVAGIVIVADSDDDSASD